jgi:hypothetical protein
MAPFNLKAQRGPSGRCSSSRTLAALLPSRARRRFLGLRGRGGLRLATLGVGVGIGYHVATHLDGQGYDVYAFNQPGKQAAVTRQDYGT